MYIKFDAISTKQLRVVGKILNDSDILEEKLDLSPGRNKKELAEAFVELIEKSHELNKLDDIPDEVYDYYVEIVEPEKPILNAEEVSERKEDAKKYEEVRAKHREKMKTKAKKARARKIQANTDDTATETVEPKKRGRGRPKKIETAAPSSFDQEESVAIEPPRKRGRGRPKKDVAESKKETSEKIETKKVDPPKRRGRPKRVLAGESTEGQVTPAKRSLVKKAITNPGKRAKGPKNGDGKRKTRAAVYVEIIMDGTPRTKQEIVSEMMEKYGGSHGEAPYWVGNYNNLLIALGKMVKYEDGTFEYQD